MEITGKVLKVTENEQISENLTKRLLIVEYAENPQYPETISFEAVNTKTSLLDNLRPGQQVTVHFNLKGREYKGKYYNTLSVWKVE